MLEKLFGSIFNRNAKTPIKNPEKPEFQGNYTRRRVIGTEQEFGIWPVKSYDLLRGFVENGGRVYSCSGGHPEYASPEASNPVDAVIYSKAGELLMQRELDKEFQLFKNVSDGHGETYASHESYSLKRMPMNKLKGFLIPFLTTRIIYAGAGGINGQYIISQRTNGGMKGVSGNQQTIFNERDESLTHDSGIMRLHVTCGDANMSEIAEFLKLGTTALILDLIEDEKLNNLHLESAADTFREISRDLKLKEKFRTSEGDMTAIELQRYYQQTANSAYRGRDDITDDVLARWEHVLNTLEQDPMKLTGWLDWVTKKNLIDSYMAKNGKSLTDSAVRNIDLQYHEVNRDTGLFYKLQSRGLVERLVTDEQIEHAVDNPPEDTRAWIRGRAVNMGDRSVDWEFAAGKVIDDPLNNYNPLKKLFSKNGN